MPLTYSGNGKIITFNEPLVMAILNVTPDSFYDGGKYGSTGDLLRDAAQKLEEGAQLLDVGAVSTRPGAALLTPEEEWARLEAVLPALRREFPEAILSVDTFRAEIAKRSVQEGANMINDVGGGRLDATMFATVAALDVPYVLMHMQGTPATMQMNPTYTEVVSEVNAALQQNVAALNALGFYQIVLDPGFGFGKTTAQNFSLLKGLAQIAGGGLPVLAGLSRKSMINRTLGTSPVTALNGTTVLNTLALLNGASVLRVHDVTEARQAVALVESYKNA